MDGSSSDYIRIGEGREEGIGQQSGAWHLEYEIAVW